MRLPDFPRTVDERAARLVAGAVVVMGTAVLLGADLLLPFLAYGFVARALNGPRFSPLARLVTGVAVPALPGPARPVAGPPKRFAQSIGAAFTLGALAATVLGATAVAQGLLVVLVAFAALEAAIGLCVGCKVFGLLMRAGVIPDDVCADCGDIWARRERLSSAA